MDGGGGAGGFTGAQILQRVKLSIRIPEEGREDREREREREDKMGQRRETSMDGTCVPVSTVATRLALNLTVLAGLRNHVECATRVSHIRTARRKYREAGFALRNWPPMMQADHLTRDSLLDKLNNSFPIFRYSLNFSLLFF